VCPPANRYITNPALHLFIPGLRLPLSPRQGEPGFSSEGVRSQKRGKRMQKMLGNAGGRFGKLKVLFLNDYEQYEI
jgi:hypothetical protein